MHRINKQFYRDMFQRGISTNEIDKSDIFFLFDLYGEDQEKVIYADQVPWL